MKYIIIILGLSSLLMFFPLLTMGHYAANAGDNCKLTRSRTTLPSGGRRGQEQEVENMRIWAENWSIRELLLFLFLKV